MVLGPVSGACIQQEIPHVYLIRIEVKTGGVGVVADGEADSTFPT